MDRAETCIRRVLRHEGGFVNDPRDPGGATNLGVTIGTAKRLGIDVDGDGDTDIVDIQKLRVSDAVKVYRHFYWNAVQADLLPVGVDYATFDYAVNSGVSRASKALQGVVGAAADGSVGPNTIAAARQSGAASTVEILCDQRMAFLRRLSTWRTFGRGWTRRVDEVRRDALKDIENDRLGRPPVLPDVEPVEAKREGGLAGLIKALLAMFTKRG